MPLSTEQLSFLDVASGALILAWLVGRYGIIGFGERSESGKPTETWVRHAPLPPQVLVPVLVSLAFGGGFAFLFVGGLVKRNSNWLAGARGGGLSPGRAGGVS